MSWKQDVWEGCYPSQWKGMIVPEAMAHPAKFSSRLIRRIYEHMLAEGWLKAGDTVIDPFGGIGLGALDAMRLGLKWIGSELEIKFVDLGGGYDCPGFSKLEWVQFYGRASKVNYKYDFHWCPECVKGMNTAILPGVIPCRESHHFNGNIDLWNRRFSRMPRWSGDAVLLQGDSRKLGEVLFHHEGTKEHKGGMVSSPPFVDSLDRGNVDAGDRRKLARENGISNAEFISPIDMEKIGGRNQEYGITDGQLGGMKDGGFEGAISSPPFEQRAADGGWQMLGKYAEEGKLTVKQVKGDPGKSYPSWNKDRDTSYGESEGQMGTMKSTVEGFEAALSSPPYNLPMSQDHNGKRGGLRGTTPSEDGAFVKYGNTDGQLEGMSSTDEGFMAAMKSPPFGSGDSGSAQSLEHRGDKSAEWLKKNTGWKTGYGDSDGQLDRMQVAGFDAAISSPPFRHSEGGTGAQGGTIDDDLMRRHSAGNSAAEGYGGSDGQLANMGEGDFRAAISSPPYEAEVVRNRSSHLEKARMEAKGYKPAGTAGMTGYQLLGEAYGHEVGQLADESGDDFWMAARVIVEQVYMVLAPGAHACWVVKGFVKNKEYVDFPDQWRQLCEAVGFVTLHEHRATLVHNKGTSHTLEGGTVEHKTESKSFFRRLAEKKGSPRIDFETVWCMVKPGREAK